MTAPVVSEDQLEITVLEACAVMGLRTVHYGAARTTKGWRTPVRGDGKGWPDLVIVGPGGLIVRELKTDKGRLRPEQQQWIAFLRAARVDVDVWRPADLRSGRITAELQALRRARRAA